MSNHAACRGCGAELREVFVDLGKSPLCERFLREEQLNQMEPFFPLKVWVCHECFLVQLQEYVAPDEIFSHYAYFSSYSTSWLEHAKKYVDYMIERFHLGSGSKVVELASNDGYLLQWFVQRGVPCLGIDPAANVVEKAKEKGVRTIVRFFGAETAREVLAAEGHASHMLGNNVLAHVPDIQDFVEGIAILLAPEGQLTMEFPHLLRLIEGNQFDTIYHEHFSYLSLAAVQAIFKKHGLRVFDVEEWPTHGGSLRVFACHEDAAHVTTPAVQAMLDVEKDFGLTSLDTYAAFRERVIDTKNALLEFLIQARRDGKKVAAYGAPGKGNTLLNYCGIREDLIRYAVDRSPFKHGLYCPGTAIPIHPVEFVDEDKPDYLVILPWNLTTEIVEQMKHVRAWGCQFVTPIPRVAIVD
jgi:SAM-dependent methyltransferase